MRQAIVLIASLLMPVFAQGDELFMVRTQESFPEAMLRLQQTIADHGYKLSRVQRVDIGLTKSGFKTDKYRVVFFGKADEVEQVTQAHPELLAYLPLKIAIFAEGTDTLLIAADPEVLFGSVDPQLKEMIHRWQQDVDSIFRHMRDGG